MPARWRSWLVAGSLGVVSLQAGAVGDVELLVGTYTLGTQGASEGIYRYRFDSQQGLIEPNPLQVIKTRNPSWLVLSRDQRRLFAVNENGPGQVDGLGRVSSFAIDPRSHWLSLINQVQSQGDEPTFASLSADERYLFIANYAVHPQPGGSLAVIPVDAAGRLAPVVQQSSHAASRIDPERQRSAHVHSVVPSPDGRYVFASDLGADKVFIYRYAPSEDRPPLSEATPAAIELPPGSGPRHLWFSVDGRHAYLTLELTSQVAVFDYADGTLIRRQLLDLADPTTSASNAAGALHGSPDGKFLYVSNRAQANQLVVYAIDPLNGLLTEIQRRSVEGDHPREFSLDPSGRFVLIANQQSNQIVVLERDPRSGLLGKTLQKLPIGSPADVKFLTRP